MTTQELSEEVYKIVDCVKSLAKEVKRQQEAIEALTKRLDYLERNTDRNTKFGENSRLHAQRPTFIVKDDNSQFYDDNL